MQLGYIANGGLVQLSDVQMISCVVQGTRAKADDLEAAVEYVYAVAMPAALAALTPRQFEAIRHSFSEGLSQKPFHTQEEQAHFWSPILSGSNCFRRREGMLRYLNTSLTSKDVLVSAWRNLMMPTTGIRKKVVVKYFGGNDGPPPRRTASAAKAAWSKQQLPARTLQMLEEEHLKAVQFNSADSTARRAILAAPGAHYFPPELPCIRLHDTSGQSFLQQRLRREKELPLPKRHRQYMLSF